MSSPNHGDSGALKRNATQAGLDNLVHPQPKRVKRLSFIEEEDEELDLSVSVPAITESQSPSLPPLPSPLLPAPAGKSPSPDYGPPPSSSSPLGVIATDEVISAAEFATFEQQRARDEHPRQVAEEAVLNAIAAVKALNGGRLNFTIFRLLQDEVSESVYSRVPRDFTPAEQVAASDFADAASQTDHREPTQSPVALAKPQAEAELTLSSVLVNATMQTEDPLAPKLAISAMIVSAATEADDSNTVTLIKPTYQESGVQADLTPVRPAPPPTPAPAPVEVDWTVLYDRELAAIRMKKPFVTGKGVLKVKVPLRPVPKPSSKPASTNNRISRPTSASVQPSRRTGNNPITHTTPSSSSSSTTRKPSASAAVTPARTPASATVISLDDSDDDVPAPPPSTTQPKRFASNISGGRASSNSDRSSYRTGAYDFDPYGYPNSSQHSGDVNSNNAAQSNQSTQSEFTPRPPSEDPSFYGFGPTDNPKEIEKLLRFQNRARDIRNIPGPDNDGRLNFPMFHTQIEAYHTGDPLRHIKQNLTGGASWGVSCTPNEDDAIQWNWLSAENDALCYVMKGFPLVENVEFLVHGNNSSPAGDCYWRSISYCLYGTGRHWDMVKAEHLSYVHHVLTHLGHDRHELYKQELNKKFFKTSSAASSGRCIDFFKANMWQVLMMAHAWTPALMQQVTADLYNICLITFTREDATITETAIRGSYNSRHVFLQYINGNHFQPMCPNHYRPSEFRYPRVTVDKTAKYLHAPKATSVKNGVLHPWRNDFTKTVPAPVPRLCGGDVNQLRLWVGSTN